MTINEIVWHAALPLAAGLIIGFWVRAFFQAAFCIILSLGIIVFGMFVLEACTHQPTFLEELGIVQRPDPVQQTLALTRATLKMLRETIASLPVATYIGFKAGIVLALVRAAKRAHKKKGLAMGISRA